MATEQIPAKAKSVGAKPGEGPKGAPSRIKWYPNERYAEIYSSGVQFALASEPNKEGEIQQCHGFAYCKDFLQDAFRAHLHNKTSHIYGFRFSNEKNPAPSLSKARIFIRTDKGTNDEVKERLGPLQACMQEAEKALKIKGRTKVYDVTDESCKRTTILVESPRTWIKHPTMLSLYTLLLRIALNDYVMGDSFLETIQKVKDGGTKTRNDTSYIKDSEPGINKIMKGGHIKTFGTVKDIKKNYPKDMPIHQLHDNTGIVFFSRNLSNKE
jgi:hypothetical protein